MNTIFHGDSVVELKKLADNSVDLLCTDPPYGYSFMGKDWDKAVPSVEVWKECLRVLKPGAFAFVMSAPRQDVLSQMIVRIGEAGFDTDFTSIYWTYATGFPKAMNIGKMVDKRLGAEREVIDEVEPFGREGRSGKGKAKFEVEGWETDTKVKITAPATDEAKALDGSYAGFQPKPAVEVVIVAMKPLSEKTYVDQALKNGKGITWLDDCRVPSEKPTGWNGLTSREDNRTSYGMRGTGKPTMSEGRFPANLVVEDDILGDYSRFFSLDKWAETLPFLAVPKASKREKNEGCMQIEGAVRFASESGSGQMMPTKLDQPHKVKGNFHPTVKPLTLMSYLITLGSTEGDVVLDPFLGSGTTACAAKHLNRQYIGIEREAEYVEIANARIGAVQQAQPSLLAAE